MRVSDLNALFVVGSLSKDSTKKALNRETNVKLFAAFDAHPLHAYSPIGRRNMCRRFGLNDTELESALLNYVRPGELSEAERRAADLAESLRVIESVISPAKRKAAPKGKSKKGGLSL